MSDMREEMLRTLDRIVEDTVTPGLREAADERANEAPGAEARTGQAAGPWQAVGPLWSALSAAGITALGTAGDGEVAFSDTMALVRQAAHHALPVPLGETIVARRLAGRMGAAARVGEIATLAPPAGGIDVARAGAGLRGRLMGVPWGRLARTLVFATDDALVLADATGSVVRTGTNMAGEPRDEVDLARVKVLDVREFSEAPALLEAEGALLRAVQLSGALTAVLDHALGWVSDRVQFGKPIAKYQAVQHLMAQLAEEVAAASAAADYAVEACEAGPDRLAIAVAKARAGEAAGKAASLAHAVFGAMGFTREHPLHYATRRLWAWRNEFGGEAYWQRDLGRRIAAAGGSQLWPLLTTRG